MHMLDWNTYRQQLVAGVGGFGKLNPDVVKGYTTLSRAGQKAGHLDEKVPRTDSACGRHHAALRRLHHGAYRSGPGTGATREEIAEVLGVAVSVNAGAAVV